MDGMLHDLQAAAGARAIVRLERRRMERGHLDGVALACSAELLLLAPISDAVRLDGLEVLRVRDVTAMFTDFPRRRFLERSLALRGESPPEPPAVDLRTIAAAVESAARLFPLLTVFRERRWPDECDIGRVERIARGTFWMRRITSAAEWVREAEAYRFVSVTRLAFGGAYETALAQVAEDDARRARAADPAVS